MSLTSKQSRDLSDKQLVHRATAGDTEAFGDLYQRHLAAIYRYIYYRVHDKATAEDLTEETFVKVWEALPRYRPRKNPFTAWLYRIAHNLVVDYHRKQKDITLPDTENFPVAQTPLSVEETIGREEDKDALLNAVKQLNEEEQTVVLLRFVEGFSHRQIARVIGKSEGASRVIQHRALAILRKIMLNGSK